MSLSNPHALAIAYAPSTPVSHVQFDACLRPWCIALAIYLLAMTWLMLGEGDFVIADWLYALQGGGWRLREHWLTVGVIHKDGKMLSQLMWLGTAIFTGIIWHRPEWRAWRRPLLILMASVVLATGVVAMIKHAVPMQCPSGLQRYGGSGMHIGLFEAWPVNIPRNACFPAAHASSGFAWIALFFFFLHVRPHWRWWGLGFGLAMGTVFAASQELRGAHFLSHDLTTIMICWGVSLLLYGVFRGRAQA